ncbi:MAG: TraB/GumN family protein [Candidatus Binatia bacterium]
MTPCNKSMIAAALQLLLLVGIMLGAGELGAQEKNFLWKVHSEPHNLYILGSIHVLKKENYPLKKIIEETFDGTNKLVLEIDLRSAKPELVEQLAIRKGMNTDGTALHQKVSKETYEMLTKRTKELGFDVGMLRPFKPWVVAMTMVAMKLQKLGFDPNLGVDRYLAERAKRVDKPTVGLETAEFQIGLFDQLSARDQERLLRQSMSDMDHLEENVDEIVQSWKTGDIDGVEKLLLAGMRDYPEIHQKVIDERNRRWVPQIENFLSGGEKALVVVGAAHLVGKNGVIELLKGRGYRVEQQ